mgnify:CR=1 FL=1
MQIQWHVDSKNQHAQLVYKRDGSTELAVRRTACQGSKHAAHCVAPRHAAGALLQLGVGELVVIHFPEGGFARTRGGQDHWQSSLKLPQKYIKGAAGAGDAFCTGILLGLHEGWDLAKCLETAVGAAGACLSDASCTGGMKSLRSVQALAGKYKFRPRLEPEQ